MRYLVVSALAASLLVGVPGRVSAVKCDGSGVPEALAAARAECCPADNSGEFVSCAAHLSNKAVKAGALAASCKRDILQSEGCASTSDPSPITTTTTTMPPSGAAGRVEICGNCIDDDGDGLTDFEDPACCLDSRTFTMTLKRARLRPRGPVTRLRLKALLGQGLGQVNPLRQDVEIQIRPVNGTDVFCARIPADKFNWRGGNFRFRDPKNTVGGAQGLNGMRIKFRPDGSLRVRTLGRKARVQMPAERSLAITVGFHDERAGDGANLCSTGVEDFRTAAHGSLVAP